MCGTQFLCTKIDYTCICKIVHFLSRRIKLLCNKLMVIQILLTDISHQVCARRLCFDLTLVFKIVRGYANIDRWLFFDFAPDPRSRGNYYKIRNSHSRLETRRYFFSCRIIPTWNDLPPSRVNATSIPSFKREVFSYFSINGIA